VLDAGYSLDTDIDYVDPALAYYSLSWQIEYATTAMLMTYPDAPAPRGSRLVPEVSRGFPPSSDPKARKGFRDLSGSAQPRGLSLVRDRTRDTP
jgi:hypothetical protein